MNYQHTPGPWIIEDRVPGREIGYRAIVAGDNPAIDRECGETICNPSPMGEANARLIAAAPDLLAAALCALADLEGVLPEADPSGDRTHPAWATLDDLRAAIAKATA